ARSVLLSQITPFRHRKFLCGKGAFFVLFFRWGRFACTVPFISADFSARRGYSVDTFAAGCRTGQGKGAYRMRILFAGPWDLAGKAAAEYFLREGHEVC